MQGYIHTNAKGNTYYLMTAEVSFGPDKKRSSRVYFFTKDISESKGTPTSIPEGWYVKENSNNGFPMLGKKK